MSLFLLLQKYYCPGGRPSRAFSASSPNPDTVCPIGTICACPQGTWTQDIAATNVEQCCEYLIPYPSFCTCLMLTVKLTLLSAVYLHTCHS